MNEEWCISQDGSYPCGDENNPDCELCHKGYQAGIKEVVEWIKKRMSAKTPISSVYDDPGFIYTYGYEVSPISEDEWWSKLKEWECRE